MQLFLQQLIAQCNCFWMRGSCKCERAGEANQLSAWLRSPIRGTRGIRHRVQPQPSHLASLPDH
jgi:hypothetical protein